MKILNGLLFLFLFGVFNVNAQNVITNEMVIEKLFYKALDSLKLNQQLPNTKLKLTFETHNDEQKVFCQSLLIKYFNAHKFAVEDTTHRNEWVIVEFKPVVEYYETGGYLFGFSKKVVRKIELSFKSYLDGELPLQEKKFWEIKLIKSDHISENTIKKLEESPYSLTHGRWINYSSWTKYLQPALIVSSLGILIFLFYSLRS